MTMTAELQGQLFKNLQAFARNELAKHINLRIEEYDLGPNQRTVAYISAECFRLMAQKAVQDTMNMGLIRAPELMAKLDRMTALLEKYDKALLALASSLNQDVKP